jgi:phage baseplate assembly protein W
MGNMVKVTLTKFNDPNKSNEFVVYSSLELNPYTNNRSILTNLDVTKQELDSLFETKKYERRYLPEYHDPLEDFVGELWNDEALSEAMYLIETQINRWIPRIVIDNNSDISYENYKATLDLVFYYVTDYSKQLYQYTRQWDTIS